MSSEKDARFPSNIVFLVEDTSNLLPYVEDMKHNYLLPTLNYFKDGDVEDKEYEDYSKRTLYGLVTYHGSSERLGASSTCSDITTCTKTLIEWFDALKFYGEEGESLSHLAEGLCTVLQLCDDLVAYRDCDGLEVKNHCVLICNSSFYDFPALEMGGEYSGMAAEALASKFSTKRIQLSIIAPRYIPALYKLFEASGGNIEESHNPKYSKSRKDLVLLRDYKLQEYPEEPPEEAVAVKEPAGSLENTNISKRSAPETQEHSSKKMCVSVEDDDDVIILDDDKKKCSNNQKITVKIEKVSTPNQIEMKSIAVKDNAASLQTNATQQQNLNQISLQNIKANNGQTLVADQRNEAQTLAPIVNNQNTIITSAPNVHSNFKTPVQNMAAQGLPAVGKGSSNSLVILWNGSLEYEEFSNEMGKKSFNVSCALVVNSNEGNEFTASMQALPKTMKIAFIAKKIYTVLPIPNHLKNSTTFDFKFTDTSTKVENIHRKFSDEIIGLIQLRDCNIKFIMVIRYLNRANQHNICAFIPRDQTGFSSALTNIYQNQKNLRAKVQTAVPKNRLVQNRSPNIHYIAPQVPSNQQQSNEYNNALLQQNSYNGTLLQQQQNNYSNILLQHQPNSYANNNNAMNQKDYNNNLQEQQNQQQVIYCQIPQGSQVVHPPQQMLQIQPGFNQGFYSQQKASTKQPAIYQLQPQATPAPVLQYQPQPGAEGQGKQQPNNYQVHQYQQQ